jgi:hypothetical protein
MDQAKAYELLKAGKLEGSVQLHPWIWIDSDTQEYCHAPDIPSGWCVYTRIETPADPVQPFDLFEELDFDTREQAIAHGQERAACLGVELEEY